MRTSLSTLTVALMLAAAPAALAQTGTAGQPEGQRPAGAMDLDPQVEQSVRERMAPEQREIELVQTSVLNRFGGLGFHRIVDIRKQDPNYVATVENVAGETVTVEIDAATGQIVSEGPVTPAEIAGTGGATGSAMQGSGTMRGSGAMQLGSPPAGGAGMAPGTTPAMPGSGPMQPAQPPAGNPAGNIVQ